MLAAFLVAAVQSSVDAAGYLYRVHNQTGRTLQNFYVIANGYKSFVGTLKNNYNVPIRLTVPLRALSVVYTTGGDVITRKIAITGANLYVR